MSIRRGSQRRLGRPSAVIAGATVTDSTVSVISRRQAANRFAGFAQFVDVVRTDDVALAPIAESGPGGVRVIEGLGEFLQGLLARGPAQQAKLAELPDRVIEIRAGALDRLVRLADLPPARGAWGASAVAEYARTASSTISSTRSALTAARRRQRFALVSPQR